MVEKTEVFLKVKEIITPFCKNVDALAQATDDTRFLDDLDVNSARLVDIVIAMEDEFEMEVTDEQADNILTIGDAVAIIMAKSS